MWTKLEIVLSRIDHFFGDGLSSLSFLFPPNVKVCVLDLSVLYTLKGEPSPEVWSKVKVEKTDRSEFRENLKAKKYAGKERVESTGRSTAMRAMTAKRVGRRRVGFF